jgi:hypothetical protein
MDITYSKDIAVTKTAAEWFSDLIGTLEKILPTFFLGIASRRELDRS